LDYPQYFIDYFNATVQDIVDPDRVVYKPDEILKNVKENNMGKKVVAIAPDVGDFDLERKGVEYDPYLESFVIGCGGKLGEFNPKIGTTNPVVCRGIGGTSRKAITYCKENNIDFYTIDTGYMQPGTKKEYHRITKNAMQNIGPCIPREHDRLAPLKWRYRNHRPGSKILIVPPSEKVMVFNGYNLDTWMQETIAEIKKYTSMDIEVRLKPSRTDRTSTNTIQQAMEDAYCVVTYNSIAATEALLYGVPAIALAQNSATMFCNTEISQINDLYIPNPVDMTAFAAHLSYCQFTAKEMRTGIAWEILNESS